MNFLTLYASSRRGPRWAPRSCTAWTMISERELPHLKSSPRVNPRYRSKIASPSQLQLDIYGD